jgi:glycosyltransferase involved in cell wall biosynthesis
VNDLRPGVVRLVTRLNVGGPARHALLLTRGLADEYDTTLAAGTPTASEGELSDPAVPIHRVPLVRPLSAGADARSLAAVRRLLTERRPALLHTHMAKAGSLGRLAALSVPRGRRPRTLHTFHGHVLEGYFRPAVQRAFVEAERRLAVRTDVLIAVSPEIRDDLLALGIGRPEKFHVISVGIDLSSYLAIDRPHGELRSEFGLSPDTPLVGVVGRLVPIKDHATLLAAVAKLPGVHLAVIGDGEMRNELEALARELGLAERVHFTGWSRDLPAAVSDLDVVALTSRNEGTPVALIEAAAAGRPAVATDVGGVKSVVREGVTGLLAPAGDAGIVADRLARLLADPAERERFGRAGRDWVRERFGDQRLLDEVRALYSDVLGRPRRPRSVPTGDR